jgi:uncharacterized Rmd1/YagE family protein
MSDKPRTPKQQKAHEYYLKNRDRCIQQATEYRKNNEDKYRAYQTEYFKNYKYSAAYQRRLERDRVKRHKPKPEPENNITQDIAQATPLAVPLEQVETTVEEIRPCFTILRPPENKVYCVSFS